jgi:hypothetical protein
MHRQLARFVGLQQKIRVFTHNAIHNHYGMNSTFCIGLRNGWRIGRGSCRIFGQLRNRTLRLCGRSFSSLWLLHTRWHNHVEPLQPHLANLYQFGLLPPQWDMKTELLKRNQRRAVAFHAAGIQRLHSILRPRRPDAQTVAHGPDAPLTPSDVIHRDMKAIQFDMGVEAIGKPLHNSRAQKRFKSPSRNGQRYAQRDQQKQYGAAQPQQPSVPAKERFILLIQYFAPVRQSAHILYLDA